MRWGWAVLTCRGAGAQPGEGAPGCICSLTAEPSRTRPPRRAEPAGEIPFETQEKCPGLRAAFSRPGPRNKPGANAASQTRPTPHEPGQAQPSHSPAAVRPEPSAQPGPVHGLTGSGLSRWGQNRLQQAAASTGGKGEMRPPNSSVALRNPPSRPLGMLAQGRVYNGSALGRARRGWSVWLAPSAGSPEQAENSRAAAGQQELTPRHQAPPMRSGKSFGVIPLPAPQLHCWEVGGSRSG